MSNFLSPRIDMLLDDCFRSPARTLANSVMAITSLVLISCAAPVTPPNEPLVKMSRSGIILPEKSDIPTEELVDEIVDLDSNLEEKKKSEGDLQSNVTSFPNLLIEINEDVRRWIQYFSQRDYERFHRFLHRGHPYKKLIQKILRERGVPEEFYYLALIESGFTTHATSRASAVGFWQFVEGTGERYGLRTNYYVDERRDPIRATHAAAEYLLDLHNIFGSWHLAMAAYNAGEMRILRAIMRAKSRDFWTLVEKKALPRETMEYVPKFLAALIIGKNPSAYGFEAPTETEALPVMEGVELPSAVKLSAVAKLASISPMEMGRLNPHLIKGITPPRPDSYMVWVPKGTAPQLEKAQYRLTRERVDRLRPVPAESRLVVARTNRVKRGENLKAIARRFGATHPQTRSVATAKATSQTPKSHQISSSSKKIAKQYKVRKGDTLTGIANRFGLSIQSLKTLNKIRRDHVYTGQVLRIASRDI